MPQSSSAAAARDRALPIAPYLGGKRALALRLVERIEAVPHQLYAEAFVGMGGVFFRRRQRAKFEAINDAGHDVANLFRVVQRHEAALLQTLRWQLTTRDEFYRLITVKPDTLTDVERAARFLYLQRTAFGGKVSGRNFGMTPESPARFDRGRVVPLIAAAHRRLSRVVIECLPYADFIARYDRPTTLFYLDPPYWGCESDYGVGLFGRDDFEKIADALARLKGRFILSINDRPEIRRIFRRFAIEPIKTTYRISGKAQQGVRELIITGK